MLRKTIKALIALTVLSLAVPLVQATSGPAGQTQEQAAPALARPARTWLPAWATAAKTPAAAAEITATTLFANGFEGNFASEWIVQDVVGASGNWTRESSSTAPSATPHGGTYMAKFNSYDALSGNQTRVYTTGLSLSAPSYLYAGFWVYHYSSGANDALQVEVDDGSGWANVGSAIDCRSSTGWQYHVVDLSVYAGDVISLSFKGISDWGYNIYVDDIEVYYQPPPPDFSGSTKSADADFDTWTITYTVAIENSSNGDAAQAYLTDTIPANTGYVANSALASTGAITEGVGYLEWGGAVFSQTTEYLTFTVAILGAPLYDTVITNTAWISDPAASGWVSAEAVLTTPAFVPDLSASTKDTAPANAYGYRRAAVGAQFPYTITVSNSGPANATAVTVTDNLPTGSASYVPASAWADSGDLLVANDVLTWTGAVANGADVQIGLMMSAISLGLSVDNTAWVTGDGALRSLNAPSVGLQNPNAYCEGAIALDPGGDTVVGSIVSYDDDDGFWDFGADVWFTLTPTATGVITLATETGSDLAIGTSDGGCDGAFTTLDSVYGSGEINVNVNYNQLYYVTLDDTGDYTLTLKAEYEPLQPRLDGWKQGPAFVIAGDPIPYSVYAHNYGEIPASAASIVDAFPSGTVGPATNVTVDGPGSIVANDDAGLEWNGVLAPLEGVTITFELSPTAACAVPILTNTAVISAPAASAAYTVTAPPLETFVSIPYVSDLETDDGGLVAQGFDLDTGAPVTSTWEWGAPVSGPAAAHSGANAWATDLDDYFDDTITDTLTLSNIDLSTYGGGPLYLEYWDWRNHFANTEWAYVFISSTSSSGWSELWTGQIDQQSWTLHQFDLSSFVSPGDLAQVKFSWEGNDDGWEIDGWYIDDIAVYEKCAPTGLSVSKLGPDTALIGQVMTYTILVENYGMDPATGVALYDYLDPGSTYAGGALANHGALDDSLGTLALGVITWTGNITYGEALLLTIPVTASGECASVITNTAIITHASLDAELQDTAATTLVYSEQNEVDKSGPLAAVTGDVVQMQIVLSSTAYAPGMVMTDALPSGIEYAGNLQASAGTAWYDSPDDAVYWTTPVLISAAHTTRITITFDVTITASTGDIVNTAEAGYCSGAVSDAHSIAARPPCTPVTGADFDYSPAEPQVNETVVFSGTVDAGTFVLPVTYTWDLGDGVTATGVNATHTFTQSGDYTVWMTATNCGGAGVSTISHSVTVAAAVCEPVTGASFDYTPSEPMLDETITFNAIYTPANATSSTLTYSWDLGVLKSGNPVTHTYSVAGAFGITLTVANACTIPPVEYVGYVTVSEGTKYVYLPLLLKTD